jgi:LacI family transcriptional regulator
VVGFDDLLPDTENQISLTTIHQPVAQIAAAGARILLDSLESGNLGKGHVDVDVSLIVRNSSAPPRGRNGSAPAKKSATPRLQRA